MASQQLDKGRLSACVCIASRHILLQEGSCLLLKLLPEQQCFAEDIKPLKGRIVAEMKLSRRLVIILLSANEYSQIDLKPLSSRKWRGGRRECDHYCGYVAGSDGQLHMAFSPRALLMLEAIVGWSQRGGGRAAATCPSLRKQECLRGMHCKNPVKICWN